MLAVLNVAATHRDPELARQAWRLLVRTTSLAPARWRNNPPVGRVQVRRQDLRAEARLRIDLRCQRTRSRVHLAPQAWHLSVP